MIVTTIIPLTSCHQKTRPYTRAIYNATIKRPVDIEGGESRIYFFTYLFRTYEKHNNVWRNPSETLEVAKYN